MRQGQAAATARQAPPATLAGWARLRAEAAPDALVYPNDPAQPTYATLLEDAQALAVVLAELGVRTGEVISFQLYNWIEAAVINLAASIGGLIVNPIVPIYRDAEVRQMLADSAAAVFFFADAGRGFDFAEMTARLRGDVPALRHTVAVRGTRGDFSYPALVEAGRGRRRDFPAVEADAVKLLLFTSGTTGRPKGVLHSHATLAHVEQVSAGYWSMGEGDVMLMPSPVTHISGYANALELPFVVGTRSVLMESWNAAAAVELIERYHVSGTVAATPFLKELADTARAQGKTLPSLRMFACGGAAVSPDLVRDANAAFAQPCAFRVYGASEVPLVTLGFLPRRDPERAACSDGAVVDYEVRIADEAGLEVAAGAEGEILVRGPAMFIGYADAAQTREAMTADGFFRTGDLGVLSADGALSITGRKKDLIIRGGENISAREIEDVLLRHPGVRDAAVVAMPHARLGEGVCAFIVAGDPSPDFAALADFITASGLAKQKCPERVEFVDELPRTASGKVRKDVLRARIRAAMGAP